MNERMISADTPIFEPWHRLLRLYIPTIYEYLFNPPTVARRKGKHVFWRRVVQFQRVSSTTIHAISFVSLRVHVSFKKGPGIHEDLEFDSNNIIRSGTIDRSRCLDHIRARTIE